MKSGDIVEIFENPITNEKSEGKAKLIQQVKEDVGDGLSIWLVRFLSDNMECIRTINIGYQE